MRELKYLKRDYLNPDELLRFLQAAKNCGPREHSICLLLCVGFRLPEISRMRRSDLDFEHTDARDNNVHIRRAVFSEQRRGRRYGPAITLTKLPDKNRLFNLRRSLQRCVRNANDDDLVFDSHRSDGLTRSSLDKLFEGLCRDAKIQLYETPAYDAAITGRKLNRAVLKANVPKRLSLGPDALRRAFIELTRPTEAEVSRAVSRALIRAFKNTSRPEDFKLSQPRRFLKPGQRKPRYPNNPW